MCPFRCPQSHFGIKESWCFSCGLAGISWTAPVIKVFYTWVDVLELMSHVRDI